MKFRSIGKKDLVDLIRRKGLIDTGTDNITLSLKTEEEDEEGAEAWPYSGKGRRYVAFTRFGDLVMATEHLNSELNNIFILLYIQMKLLRENKHNLCLWKIYIIRFEENRV